MAKTQEKQASPYLPAPGLEEAADVAYRLGMPLLLTGEPGVGKTQAAYWLASKLSLEILEYPVRSTATYGDLFYGYNSLAHYHSAVIASRPGLPGEDGESPREAALKYIDFHALGEAILRAAAPEKVKDIYSSPFPTKTRTVVLLDEIDKAPRDLPNDILRVVETMRFSIPEVGGKTVEADTQFRPVVVATSNSERGLPDAFLRRCIYFHIPFPGKEELSAIVKARLGLLEGTQPASDLSRYWFKAASPELSLSAVTQQIADAISIFYFIRDQGLRKVPATAELLDFLRAIHVYDETESITPASGRWKSVALACLVKTEEDRKLAEEALKGWSPERKS